MTTAERIRKLAVNITKRNYLPENPSDADYARWEAAYNSATDETILKAIQLEERARVWDEVQESEGIGILDADRALAELEKLLEEHGV